MSYCPSLVALNILVAASRSESGISPTALVDAVERFTERPRPQARARVTDACRILWRRGLVELHGKNEEFGTLTEKTVADQEQRPGRRFSRFYTRRIVVTTKGREYLAAILGGRPYFPAGGPEIKNPGTEEFPTQGPSLGLCGRQMVARSTDKSKST